jgi:hypothetical protein
VGGGERGRGSNGPRRLTASGLDQTVARVSLATPVPSKAVAKVEIAWHTKLPGGPDGRGHRMTQRIGDTLFQPTQWYPRVAKYDDLRGWDTSLYLGPAEFYNNFGRFDVRLDVPGGWIVSGTGVLQNPREVLNDTARERLTHVLESDEVITIVGEDESGPGRATAPGDRLVWHFLADKGERLRLGDREQLRLAGHARDDSREGDRSRSTWFHTPDHANLYANAGRSRGTRSSSTRSCGRPTRSRSSRCRTARAPGWNTRWSSTRTRAQRITRPGHQWWPMMVGNNETWYGWMDEGFNQYMNILSDADAERRAAPRLEPLGPELTAAPAATRTNRR